MSCREWIEEYLQAMPAEERDKIAHVQIFLRGRPNARDRVRGCGPDNRGYYYGTTAELPDGNALTDETARARGEVVLFLDNIEPVTRERLVTVLQHELAHACGHDEAQVRFDLGLFLPEDVVAC